MTSADKTHREVEQLDEFARHFEEFIDPLQEIKKLVRQHKFIGLSPPAEKPHFVRLIKCMGGENYRYFGEIHERQRHGRGMFYNISPPTLFVGRFEADKKIGLFQVYSIEDYREIVYNDDLPQH